MNKNSNYSFYIHNSYRKNIGKIISLVEYSTTDNNTEIESLSKNLCMHIAAMKPLAVSQEGINKELVEKEEEIFLAQAKESGKPENIVNKMVEGKVKKFYEENTLLNQKFVMDPDSSINHVLEKNNQVLINFVRFKVGEGIDKKESDFATEVKDIVN